MRVVVFDLVDGGQVAVVAENVANVLVDSGGDVRIWSLGDTDGYLGCSVKGSLAEVAGKLAGVKQPDAACSTCSFWYPDGGRNRRGTCRAKAPYEEPAKTDWANWCREHFPRAEAEGE